MSCFIPNRFNIIIQNISNSKLANYFLHGSRSIHNYLAHIGIFKDRFSELVFFCSVKYLFCELRFNRQ